jgi:putative copper resistance protein D
MSESLNVAALYAATILIVGACTAMWLVRATAAATPERIDSDTVVRLGKRAAASAVTVWLLLLVRLLTHSIAVFGLPTALTLESLRIVGFQSRWGGGWRAQMMAATACLAGALWNRRTGTLPSLSGVSVAVLALAFTLPLSGHAAGSVGLVAVAGAHLLAAGAWIGTLAILLTAIDVAAIDGRHPLYTSVNLFGRFSILAMFGVGTVVATGIIMVWLYVDSPLTIFNSGYGRLLAVKLSLFAAVSVCGFLNWRRTRIGRAPSAAAWEVALAAVLVLITGFLTQTSPP